jgi:hypothetical protein
MEQVGISSHSSLYTEKRCRANIAGQQNKTAKKPHNLEKPLKNLCHCWAEFFAAT